MKVDPHGLLRSFVAIAGGFMVFAALLGIASVALRRLAPAAWREGEGEQSKPAMLGNLLLSVVCALAGGITTAMLAPAAALPHTLMLALAVLVLAGIAAFDLPKRFAMSYRIALIALPAIAALGGGILVVLFR